MREHLQHYNEWNYSILSKWNESMLYVAFLCWGIALTILLVYLLIVKSKREYKIRYDFIIKSEIKTLWVSILFALIGFAALGNTNVDEISPLWIFIRVFSTISLFTIGVVVMQNLLKFYYPFYMEKRLEKLRYKPRISTKTGKPMRLLSEEEEDAYLDKGMQEEESIFSVDYDVWKDEETGYIKVERYSGHLHAIECPECNYTTLKVVEEQNDSTKSVIIQHYNCSYCGHKMSRQKNVKTPKQS